MPAGRDPGAIRKNNAAAFDTPATVSETIAKTRIAVREKTINLRKNIKTPVFN